MIAGEDGATQDSVAVICDNDLANPEDRSGKFGGQHTFVIDGQRYSYLRNL
jgi:hypothetical protein